MPLANFANSESCEVRIFKSDIISDNCDIRLTKVRQEKWIALLESNTWLFFPFGEQKIQLECFNNVSEHFFANESLMININAGCQIYSERFVLTAFYEFSSPFSQPMQRNIRFSSKINNTINEILRENQEIDAADFSDIVPNFDRDRLLKIFHDSSRLKEKIRKLRETYASNLPTFFKLDDIILFVISLIVTFILFKLILKLTK